MHDILIPYGKVHTVFVQRVETWCKATNTHIHTHTNTHIHTHTHTHTHTDTKHGIN